MIEIIPPARAPATTAAQRVVYASRVSVLDSSVLTGGGTDDTTALQSVLAGGNVELVMDGAALVTGLYVGDNTTIRCVDQSCGFYLKSSSPRPIVQNLGRNITTISNFNIKLIGGIYNGNAANQGTAPIFETRGDSLNGAYVTGLEFDGVDGLLIRDVETRDILQMNIHASCVKNVYYQNVWCHAVLSGLGGMNTVGFPSGVHFNGPSDHIVLRDIRANVGDDSIALNASDDVGIPQWGSGDITDVLIDGLTMDGSRQGIRLLASHNANGDACGIDRVIIRNVKGTAYACALQVNHWTNALGGTVGTLTVDTMDVRVAGSGYPVGGGGPDMWCYINVGCPILNLILNGFSQSDAFDARPAMLFESDANVGNLVVTNAILPATGTPISCLGTVPSLVLSGSNRLNATVASGIGVVRIPYYGLSNS